MNVIVDTSAWSLAFRRQEQPIQHSKVIVLQDLIKAGRAILLGVVRQEILSGIRSTEQFDRLRNGLRAFPDLPLDIDDYELASELFNTCRRRGIQGSNTDFLICATAIRRSFEILTTDKDFTMFQSYIPIHLLEG